MTARRLATVLGTVFGLQALRAFFPLLLYVLKDRFGLSSIALGEIGMAVFATGFLAPWLSRRGLLRAFVALIAARGALQLWTGDPVVSLALAAAGVVSFLAFLAAPGADRAPGFLIGALVDVALHAAFGTRDLHWGGPGTGFVTGSLIGAAILVAIASRRGAAPDLRAPTFGLLAIGPFLFLQLELLGNVARLSARTGLPTCYSGAAVAAGLALAAALAPQLARAGPLDGLAGSLAAAGFLVPSMLRAEVAGPIAVPLLWIAQLAAALLLIRALDPSSSADSRGGRRAAAMGAGSLLLIALLFLHYASYDLPLPVGRTGGKLVAAGALIIVAWSRRKGRGVSPPALTPTRAPLGIAVACAGIALLPLLRGVPTSPAPTRDDAAAVVVTFNLHAGFDERGGWAFDRMIRSLKEQRPDVAALQEVSRGWVVNGSADLYELAREQLGLTGAYGPSVTTDWGNAVFVRGTIVAASTSPLPPRDLALTRSVLLVERAEGDGYPRRIVATHLHHRTVDDAIRELQARAIAAAFPGSREAVLLADFNAQPASQCFSILRGAGWSDAGGAPEIASAAPTFPAVQPVRRIDTIFVGDPARVVSCEVAPPWGSDHRAVIARLRSDSE